MAGIRVTSNDSILSGNNVLKNYHGIFLGVFVNGHYSTISNNTLSGNNVSSNNNTGIYLIASNNNTLNRNNVSNNPEGIMVQRSSNNNLSGNNFSNNIYGIVLFSSSSFNSIEGNKAFNNSINGIDLSLDSNHNFIIGNNASKNSYGIVVYLNSSNNTLADNIAKSNSNSGISLDSNATNNKLYSNNASKNDIGITLFRSSNNTLSGNNVSDNNYGIYLQGSGQNTVYNNYLNNTNNFLSEGIIYSNILNTTKTSGMNIIGGPYFGGNVWANPRGTGFSQTCTDGDKDEICDSPYTLDSNNIDYLPLTIIAVSPLKSITVTPSASMLTEGGRQQFNATAQNQNNNPIPGIYISWAVSNLTVGSVTPVNAITGADGNASVTFTASAAGTAMLNATNGSVAGNATITVKALSLTDITVTIPNGGENWRRGTVNTIRWTYNGTVGPYVRIDLLKNGLLSRTIASRASMGSGGFGSYRWSISGGQTPGTDYKVRVTSTSAPYGDTSDNNFTIKR
jgi:parallel beta-helix repeat protein